MVANMKAVKLRMKSIQSTMQITKAMELVASSKLRKAKERADNSRPYFHIMHDTLTRIALENTDFVSPYSKTGKSENYCYIVIAGDRGLAGGYNSNLFKLVDQEIAAHGEDYHIFPLGKKAVEHYHKSGRSESEEYDEVESISVADCFEIAKGLCKGFLDGKFGHIILCHTAFRSMLSQSPVASPLLPLEDVKKNATLSDDEMKSSILYEPDSETVFQAIVPEYIAGLIYTAVCDSIASELAARRTAMDAATKNAGEMIDKLSLYYNRARQASITQEITEIVAGAEEI